METKNLTQPERPVVFSMPNEKCIWSKAGVVASTECINAFDCLGCPLEKSIRADFEEKSAKCRIPGVYMNGDCRHVLSGRLSYGKCSSESCANCPVEQMIEDSVHIPVKGMTNHSTASGFGVARNYYYHKGHTWARVEYGGWVRIGIDDFALRLLGKQDVIETPGIGSVLRQGQPIAILRRDGKEAQIISPVDGVVVALNHRVLENAKIANDAPYEDGWLLVIQPTNLQENLKRLLFDSDALPWMDEESISLNTIVAEESRIELVAADSELPDDFIRDAPEVGWDRLVEEFL